MVYTTSRETEHGNDPAPEIAMSNAERGDMQGYLLLTHNPAHPCLFTANTGFQSGSNDVHGGCEVFWYNYIYIYYVKYSTVYTMLLDFNPLYPEIHLI